MIDNGIICRKRYSLVKPNPRFLLSYWILDTHSRNWKRNEVVVFERKRWCPKYIEFFIKYDYVMRGSWKKKREKWYKSNVMLKQTREFNRSWIIGENTTFFSLVVFSSSFRPSTQSRGIWRGSSRGAIRSGGVEVGGVIKFPPRDAGNTLDSLLSPLT
jgi:hypothetical protein